MNCQEVVELIQRYMDLDLAGAEEQILLSHLKKCPECAELFEKYKLLSNGLESLPKVTPPYSIVDAILPKLQEMRLYPEDSAALEPVAGLGRSLPRQGRSKVPNERGRKLRGLASWRLALGGMAAAIALGIFFSSLNGSELQQRAEGLLPPSKGDKTSDSPAPGRRDSVNNKPGSSAQPGINGNNGGTTGGQPGQLAVPDAPSAVTPKPGEPSSPGETPLSTGDNSAGLGTGLNGGPNASDPDKSLNVQQPSSLPKAPNETKEAPVSASPANTADAPSKGTPKPTPEPTPNDGVSSSARPIDSKTPAPSKEGPTFGIRGFIVPKPAPTAGHSLVSASGEYIAVIKDQTVVITDKNGKEVFRSNTRWKDDDTIRLTAWTDDSKLSYAVKSADGTEVSYTIDAAAKTETKN